MPSIFKHLFFKCLASSAMSLTTTSTASSETEITARSWKQLYDPGIKLQLTSFLQIVKIQKITFQYQDAVMSKFRNI